MTTTVHLYIEVGLRSTPVGDVAVFETCGGIDAHTRERFRTQVEAVLAQGAWSVVVNLKGVPFLDAEAIGVLLRAQRLVHATTGGTLLLATVHEQGRRTLEVKGLGSLLACFPSDAEAVVFLESWLETPRV
jgi:anti-anti-sigma factor